MRLLPHDEVLVIDHTTRDLGLVGLEQLKVIGRSTWVKVDSTRRNARRTRTGRRTGREWRTSYQDSRTHYRNLALDVCEMVVIYQVSHWARLPGRLGCM